MTRLHAFAALCAAVVFGAGCSAPSRRGDECAPEDSRSCVDGTVYWVDGCGDRGDVASTCDCGCADDGVGCAECVCTPTTCEAAGATCGTIDDGCGGILECGTCPTRQTCGGGGVANRCGTGTCTRTSCAAQGATCGGISDGCGGRLDCGTCTAPQTCGGGGVANRCGTGSCTRTTCSAQGATCGTVDDGCGGRLNCGSCTSPDTCGGGGVANRCGHSTTGPRFALESSHPFRGNANVDLNGIWGVVSDFSLNVWAVGSGGRIETWDSRAGGTGWSELRTPGSYPLWSVVATSPQNLFAVGSNTALVWDSAGGFDADWYRGAVDWLGVWGDASDHVYAIHTVTSDTRQCSIALWDGLGWVSSGLLSPYCLAIGGAGDTVWVGTTGGVYRNVSDSGWNAQPSDGVGLFTDVWASDAQHAWMVGTEGLIAYDGRSQTWFRDGSLVRPHGESLNGVYASSPDSIWVVGDDGLILHFDGTGWREVPNPVRGTGVALNDVWGFDDANIFVVGDSGTLLMRE